MTNWRNSTQFSKILITLLNELSNLTSNLSHFLILLNHALYFGCFSYFALVSIFPHIFDFIAIPWLMKLLFQLIDLSLVGFLRLSNLLKLGSQLSYFFILTSLFSQFTFKPLNFLTILFGLLKQFLV